MTVVCTTTRTCWFAGNATLSTDHLKVRRLFSGSSLAEPLICTVQPVSFVSVNAAEGARFWLRWMTVVCRFDSSGFFSGYGSTYRSDSTRMTFSREAALESVISPLASE